MSNLDISKEVVNNSRINTLTTQSAIELLENKLTDIEIEFEQKLENQSSDIAQIDLKIIECKQYAEKLEELIRKHAVNELKYRRKINICLSIFATILLISASFTLLHIFNIV